MKIIGVSEGVLKHIRVNIITNKFSPGQKLNEAELSKSLGISRTPIREAFRILENENLVCSSPRKGVYVNKISIKDCRDIYGVRRMLERYGIECLREKNIRKPPEIMEILADTAKLERPGNDDAYEMYEYLQKIANFHRQLIVAGENRRLVQLFDRIFPSLARYQSLYTYIPGMMEESQGEHEAIVKLINDGAYTQAKEALGSHILKFVKIIEKGLEEGSESMEVQEI